MLAIHHGACFWKHTSGVWFVGWGQSMNDVINRIKRKFWQQFNKDSHKSDKISAHTPNKPLIVYHLFDNKNLFRRIWFSFFHWIG